MVQKAHRTIFQNFFSDDEEAAIDLQTYHERDLTPEIVTAFLPADSSRSIGIAPGYDDKGDIIALAIANGAMGVLLVLFYNVSAKVTEYRGREILQDDILCRDGELFAFDLGPIALTLYQSHNLVILGGVDIQSACSTMNRRILSSIKLAVGDSVKVNEKAVADAFDELVFDPENTSKVALRAWLAQYIAKVPTMEEQFDQVKRVNTKNFTDLHLKLLADLATKMLRADQRKPTSKTHEFKRIRNTNSNEAKLQFTRYQTRATAGTKSVKVDIVSKNGPMSISASASDMQLKGRSARIALSTAMDDKIVTSVTTYGREDSTAADAQRSLSILRILQGSAELLDDNPWVQNVFFPMDCPIWPSDQFQLPSSSTSKPPFSPPPHRQINDSQLHAVRQMLSITDDDRILLIQGPPGTGKTTVIATFVEAAVKGLRPYHDGIWLIAHSNVAVKNIAEKLMAFDFKDWRILVSSDFHDDWHEHLYHSIPEYVIRSKDFALPSLKPPMSCRVILCTLSMLSHPLIRAFTRPVPITKLIIDEASQIDIGDYMSVFIKFAPTLQKLCFIGDDKQLPPFGQEDLGNVQSIFEIAPIRKQALLLDTQYRMPPQIGDFISRAIYDSQLLSNPLHPIPNSMIACHFIDSNGTEQPHGTSYKNSEECKSVIQIAHHLEMQGKKFCIITPYDGQRTMIETALHEHGLGWEDKCFNVDAFQGNEKDFIIISLVRSRDLGFTKDLRRSNVMLTRCKKGMFICSSRKFLGDIASETLSGKLAAHFGDAAWLTEQQLKEGQF